MAPKALPGTAALLSLVWISLAGVPRPGHAQSDEEVDYLKQIRPILVDYCYECHGEEKQEAELRLDSKSSAFREVSGYKIIVPGDPEESELYWRIAAEFPEDRMPPYDAGIELTQDQVELIRLWIEQGAQWEDD